MLGRTLAVERNMELKIDTTQKKYYDFTSVKCTEKNAEIFKAIKEIVAEEDIILFCYDDNAVTSYLFITDEQKEEIIKGLRNIGARFYAPAVMEKKVVARELQLEDEGYYEGYTLVIKKEEI